MTMALVQLKYVRGGDELAKQAQDAKLHQCPHCYRLGTVNSHGFLRGYSEAGERGVVRGRRFFCSNRHLRPGCGRTFSILVRDFVRSFIVLAQTLAMFLLAIIDGVSVAAAWTQAAQRCFSRSTGYRLWHRLQEAQMHWSTCLIQRTEPPPSPDPRPIAQVIDHLKLCIGGVDSDIFAGFQNAFQMSLFPNCRRATV